MLTVGIYKSPVLSVKYSRYLKTLQERTLFKDKKIIYYLKKKIKIFTAKMILSFFVLAIMVFVVEPVVAIHNLMTRAERLTIFGDEESVPEYKLYAIDLPGLRQRRESNDDIKLTVEIEGKELHLHFKPTEGKLISRYTPVWSAITDEKAYMNIRYKPLPNVSIFFLKRKSRKLSERIFVNL